MLGLISKRDDATLTTVLVKALEGVETLARIAAYPGMDAATREALAERVRQDAASALTRLRAAIREEDREMQRAEGGDQ